MKQVTERWKELGKYRYALLVAALGALLMLLPAGRGRDRPPEPESPGGAGQFRLEEFEVRLEKILSRIRGAGRVDVVLTLDGGSRQILAQDQEHRGQGEGSTTTVTVGGGSGTQQVVPLQTIAPKFRGALVVCPGGDMPGVRLQLIQALSALTGLRADRISVCEGNGK